MTTVFSFFETNCTTVTSLKFLIPIIKWTVLVLLESYCITNFPIQAAKCYNIIMAILLDFINFPWGQNDFHCR